MIARILTPAIPPISLYVKEKMMPIKPPLQETLFADGSAYYEALIADIRRARYLVLLETYIFASDEIGEKVAEALAAAGARGVSVRLLVDGNGLPLFFDKIAMPLQAANVQVRLYHPLPWRFWQWKHSVSNRPLSAGMIRLLTQINHRDHRKLCVIDHNIAWIGSFNICNCHLSQEHGGGNWRDTAVRLENINTSELEKAFERAWHPHHLHRFGRPPKRSPFRLNDSRRRRRRLTRDLLRRIGRCKQRIWITNAYFVPDERLLKQLQRAAKGGVDVRIILPLRSDVFFMPWTSSVFYASLLSHGIRIFEYRPAILHAKTLILDQWMTVGSSNLNRRSLLHDLEVDAVIRTPASKQRLLEQFLDDMAHSNEVSLADYPKRPLWQRLIAHAMLAIKHWL